jgi:lipopolysaccharide assembly protein A
MTSSLPPTGPEPVPPPLSGAASGGEPAAKSKGLRISPKFVLTVVILAAVLWFAFANTKNAQIKLWVHTVQAPVWLVLLGTFVVGVLVGLLLRRRRKPH